MSKHQDKLNKFLLDPDWNTMEEFIFSHFDSATDIAEINTENSPETVHAEVIASQKINGMLQDLKNSFENARGKTEQNNPSFR